MLPKTETYYEWKVLAKDEDWPSRRPSRLMTPWADPMQYEFPFDFIFNSPEEAYEGLDTFGARDYALEEGWILVKSTYEPIAVYSGPSSDDIE